MAGRTGRPQSSHTNVYLTNHYIKWPNPGFIADIVSPRIRVPNKSDKYPVWDKEYMRLVNTKRAPMAESEKSQKSWSDDTFSCETYALHDLIGSQDSRGSDTPVRPEFDVVEDLASQIMLNWENEVYAVAAASASVLAANKLTLAAGEEWNAASDASKPIDNIDDLKGRIFASSRMKANALILPYEDALKLKSNIQIRDLLKGISPDLVTGGGLPKVIAGLWVIEAGAGYDESNRGQTASIASLWSSGTAYVAYIDGLPQVGGTIVGGTESKYQLGNMPKSNANKITWIRTFEWLGRIVREWLEPRKQNARAIEVEEQGLDCKLISNTVAASVTNTIAS